MPGFVIRAGMLESLIVVLGLIGRTKSPASQIQRKINFSPNGSQNKTFTRQETFIYIHREISAAFKSRINFDSLLRKGWKDYYMSIFYDYAIIIR